MKNQDNQNVVFQLINRVFPRPIDFYSLLDAQCAVLVEALTAFDGFMSNDDVSLGEEVLRLEHVADDLKHSHMDQLNKTFATPIDREDIVRAIVSLDDIIGYAKTTVREVELLKVEPDEPMREMANLILDGGRELQQGYQQLRKHPLDAELNAQRAHKTERAVEKVYRRAVSELLDDQRLLDSVKSSEQPEIAATLHEVVIVLRRRELYRHLSNAADRVEKAAEILHDIVVKIA